MSAAAIYQDLYSLQSYSYKIIWKIHIFVFSAIFHIFSELVLTKSSFLISHYRRCHKGKNMLLICDLKGVRDFQAFVIFVYILSFSLFRICLVSLDYALLISRVCTTQSFFRAFNVRYCK